MSAPAQRSTRGQPDIRQFGDYRAFLRALIPYLKATDPEFSYRTFARRAGFSSPNYLKLVAEGHRNLAPASVDKFARGLGLSRREREIFRQLVLIEAARDDDAKNAHVHALLGLVGADDDVARLRADQFAVYRAWYPMVIREMVSLPDFQDDPGWIAQRLYPRITEAQARRALDLLVRVGLLVRGDDGRLRQAEPTVTTGPEVANLAIRNFHRAHLELAAESLEAVPRDERNVTAVTVPLTREGYAEAVAEIARLRRRLLELSRDVEAGAEDVEVHHVAIAMYPVTRRPRRGRARSRRDGEPADDKAREVR